MKRSAAYTNELDPRRVDVLDGIRALAVLIIMWYHIWQQSWLMPVFHLPFLAKLGLSPTINLDFIPRHGYIFVDLMLLISAFCLFLPHARARLMGESLPGTWQFYKKRLVRIVPPYLLSVLLITFAWALPTGAFPSTEKFLVDFFSTVSFTQTFFPTALLLNTINGVLWTVVIEMQFYLIFPLLAFCFRKRPLISYIAMVGIASIYIYGFALPNEDTLRMTVNQLPAFFGVFANGMLAAYIYVALSKRLERRRWISLIATLLAVGFLLLIGSMQKSISDASLVQVWQLEWRFVLSLAFVGFILSAALSAKWFRWLFSNKVMGFLAAISYNVYIWHQWLALRFVEWRIPFWTGDTRPNVAGDTAWQWKYTLLVVAASLAAAAIVTYGFEKPISKILLKSNRRIPSEPKFITEENHEDIPV